MVKSFLILFDCHNLRRLFAKSGIFFLSLRTKSTVVRAVWGEIHIQCTERKFLFPQISNILGSKTSSCRCRILDFSTLFKSRSYSGKFAIKYLKSINCDLQLVREHLANHVHMELAMKQLQLVLHFQLPALVRHSELAIEMVVIRCKLLDRGPPSWEMLPHPEIWTETPTPRKTELIAIGCTFCVSVMRMLVATRATLLEEKNWLKIV